MISILRFAAAAAVAAAFKSSASSFPHTQPHFGQPVSGDNPEGWPRRGAKGAKKQLTEAGGMGAEGEGRLRGRDDVHPATAGSNMGTRQNVEQGSRRFEPRIAQRTRIVAAGRGAGVFGMFLFFFVVLVELCPEFLGRLKAASLEIDVLQAGMSAERGQRFDGRRRGKLLQAGNIQ